MMPMNHIITTTDELVHEIQCIDHQGEVYVLTFTHEIELNEDVVKVLTMNEEEAFVIHDSLLSELYLEQCDDVIVLTKKASEVCFKVENATQDYMITWCHQNESFTFCLNAENDYCKCISNISCGMSELKLPDGLLLCDEDGEHSGCIEIMFKAGSQHCVILKERKQLPLQITACKGYGEILVTMHYQQFHQCIALNEQNHYQVQFNHLLPGQYTFECDENYVFYQDAQCLQQKVILTIGKEPLYLWVAPKTNGSTSLYLHNTSDCELCFSLFSLSCHECITLEPFKSICLEKMHLGAYSLQSSSDKLCVCFNGVELEKSTFCIEHEGITHLYLSKKEILSCAHLQVCFYEESLCAEIITPSVHRDCSLTLSSGNMRYDLLLNTHNSFQACLNHLPTGYYQVNCDASYRLLLDGAECNGIILLNGQHTLQIISPLERYYTLNIALSCDAVLSSDIEGILQSKKEKIAFCLNAENGYCVDIEQLVEGEYQLLLSCVQDYQVIYQWNGCFKAQPLFHLCHDSELQIQLEPFEYGGMLSMRLLQEDANGQLSLCTSGTYHIQMKGYGYSHTHCFHENNGYEIALCNLKAMTYQVSLCEGTAVQIQAEDGSECSCFELTQEDLAIDIILKYVAEDVVVKLDNAQECVCLLCHHNQEEMLRFYAGNQYTCILSQLPHGLYEIKGLYDQKYLIDINHRPQGCQFKYDGNALEIILHLQTACAIDVQMEPKLSSQGPYELVYKCNQKLQRLSFNKDNHYHQLLYCQKYDEIEMIMEDALFMLEGEQWDGTGFQVIDEHLTVQIMLNPSRCVLLMEKSQCSCMEDKISFEMEYDGQKAIVEMNQQRGIRLPKGKYRFIHDDYAFVLDGVEGTTFDLQEDQHHLMIVKKTKGSRLFIQSDKECQGVLIGEHNQFAFVLNAANQYLAVIENVEIGTYQVQTTPQCTCTLDELVGSKIELSQAEHHLHLTTVATVIQLIKYEKRNGVYSRHHLRDLSINVNGIDYQLNAENNWQISLELSTQQLQVCAQGSGEISYLIDGKEYPTCDIERLTEMSIGIIEDSSKQGVMKIHAMIQDVGGYRAIQDDDHLSINVLGFDEEVVLSKENQYTCTLSHLPFQAYQISCNQEVSYLLNGEVNQGTIYHYGDDVLRIVVKAKQAEFIFELAEQLEEAQFHVWNGAQYELVHLDKTQSCYVMKVQTEGVYIVDDHDDYMYVIDDVKEIRYPVLKGDASHHIEVRKQVSFHLHTLTIEKKIMQQGELSEPASNQVFEVDILSFQMNRRIRLDASNHFTMVLDQLPCGDYEVKEVEQDHYESSYIVNDGIRSTKANIHLQQDVHVCIINEESMKQGSLKVKKVIENGTGELITPASGDIYRFLLETTNESIEIVLQASNQYQQWIYPLKEGIYTLKEIDALDYATQYQINGGTFQKEANIIIKNGSCVEVTIKNQRLIDQAALNVFQYLQQDGSYVKPTSGTFTFLLQNEQTSKQYELNKTNDYQLFIEGLLPGKYELIATAPNSAYLIDDTTLQKQAIINLESDSESVIAIIQLAEKMDKKDEKAVNKQVLKMII